MGSGRHKARRESTQAPKRRSPRCSAGVATAREPCRPACRHRLAPRHTAIQPSGPSSAPAVARSQRRRLPKHAAHRAVSRSSLVVISTAAFGGSSVGSSGGRGWFGQPARPAARNMASSEEQMRNMSRNQRTSASVLTAGPPARSRKPSRATAAPACGCARGA